MSARTSNLTVLALAGLFLGLCYVELHIDDVPIDPAGSSPPAGKSEVPEGQTPPTWPSPDVKDLPHSVWGDTVRYGRELVVHTARHLGPGAKDPALRRAGNNLDCQSCHIEAGTQRFGLPFIGVFSAYPGYRARSGKVGTLEERIQGCMTRSMNGRPLDPDGFEMTALIAYFRFVSQGIEVGEVVDGRGLARMPLLERAADPRRGSSIFRSVCAACHGSNGQGQPAAGQPGYNVPPLWGEDSFNDGAGMARLITAANFIHDNMPHGTTWQAPALSVADSWDVAAYVIGQPRPHKTGREKDYPNLAEKPLDAGYPPFADRFTLAQHRLGPFGPMRGGTAGPDQNHNQNK